MRCPKCGYNSFDHLDSCKKCGKDLVEFKERYSIRSVLFPGQMKPAAAATGDNFETGRSAVDDAVAAATTATVVAAAASTAEASAAQTEFAASSEPASSEADDFGFDFMGESGEEEDLSFDELFEDAPADEDVEETLPSPEEEAAAAAAEAGLDAPAAFSLDAEQEAGDEKLASEAELESDFGFDLDGEEGKPGAPDSSSDNFSAEDFELPVTDEEDFSFRDDNIEFADSDEKDKKKPAGAEEDPKDPFDLPGSPQGEGNPVSISRSDEHAVSLSVATDAPRDETAETEKISAPPEPGANISDAPDDSDTHVALSPASRVEAVAEDLLPEPENLATGQAAGEPCLEESDTQSNASEDLATEEAFFTEPEHLPEAETARSLSDPPAERAKDFAEQPEASLFDVPETPRPPLEKISAAKSAQLAAAGAASAQAIAAQSIETAAGIVSVAGEKTGIHPPLVGRVAAFCCDLLLLCVTGLSFIVAAELAMADEGDGWLPSLDTLINLSVPYFLVLFCLAFGYFTLFHFLAGQTPGKMLAGLQVETLAGEPLQLSQAFLRSVGGLLQALPLGLGYLVVLFSEDRRGWNDRLAGTRLTLLKKTL